MTRLTALFLALGVAAAAHADSRLPARMPTGILLANGLQVDVVPLPGARVFAFIGRIDAGFAHDTPACPGVSAVAAEWLAWPAVGEDVRSPPIRWTSPADPLSAASPRWIEFRSTGFIGQEDRLLRVLAGRLSSVARAARVGVAREEWARFRVVASSRARAAAGTVEGRLWGGAFTALYPSGSSLASAPWGPEGRVGGNAAAFQSFLAAHVTPARTRVVIAGDFQPAELRARLERTLGRVPAGSASSRAPSLPVPVRRKSSTVVRLPRADLRNDHLLVVSSLNLTAPEDGIAARALVFLLRRSGVLARELVEPRLAPSVRAGLVGSTPSRLLFARTAASPVEAAGVLAGAHETFDALARGRVDVRQVAAFLARERAEQASGDPLRCAARRLLGQPDCGAPSPVLRPDELAEAARRLLAAGAPLAVVLGPGGGARPIARAR